MPKFLIALFFVLICSLVPNIAYGQDSQTGDEIRVVEGSNSNSSFLENAFSGICDGSYFRIALRFFGSRSYLSEFSRNGMNAPESETEQIRGLLANSRGATLSLLRCRGSHEVMIAISGSLVDPGDGEDDDYVRFFTVTFPRED